MIYINGRFLEKKVTGVQRFSLEITRTLSKLRDDIIVLIPANIININFELLEGFNYVVVTGFSGNLWEQVSLPNYLKKLGKPLLLNLSNSAPLFYDNKIITHHDISYTRYPQSYTKKYVFYYKLTSPLILKKSVMIFTVSEFSKKEIIDFYGVNPNKIHVIPNAVNDIFKSKNTNEFTTKPFALAVSSPCYHKNFDLLIDSFLEKNLDLDLKIIGSISSTFSSRKKDLITDERVQFLGRVSDEELINLYQQSLFFVFPSLYEGFGIPPLEAQSCGCPVISSNAASMPEVLRTSAYYFDPKSKISIQDSLVRITTDINLRKKLINLGFENIKRFSWEKSGKIINDILNNNQST